MRRAPLVGAATLAGLAGVLSFHTHPTRSNLATTASASGPRSKTSSRATATGSTRSATGKNEQYGYGTLALKVTVSGKKITDVSVASIQEADPTSNAIASQVIPMLRSQVLKAQSAHINGISGASYTSQAYALSVQSALDKLHFA